MRQRGWTKTKPSWTVTVFSHLASPRCRRSRCKRAHAVAIPFGLTVGLGARWIGDRARRHRGVNRLRASSALSGLAGALCVTIIVSTALSLARNNPIPLSALPSVLRGELANLALFNPPGLAGALQAGWIALSGPLVFLATFAVLVDERRRRPPQSSHPLTAKHRRQPEHVRKTQSDCVVAMHSRGAFVTRQQR